MAKDIYQFQNLLGYRTVVHGVSTKAFGSMKNIKDLQIDREKLNMFAQKIGVNSEIVCMKQIHSGNVMIVENNSILRIDDTDSLITNKRTTPLAVLTADCLPIMFYDPKKEVIGVAHAGYRGLLNHIIENTIEKLISQFECNPNDILVGIGPSIETLCYEVGEELIEEFQSEFPSVENIFVEKDQKFFLNLKTITQQILIKKGIVEENIENMDICTKCDPNFYSYRGGDGDKRFASIISLI